jgi:hypothetical protein
MLQALDEAAWAAPETLLEAERSSWGTDHAHSGAEACARWALPTRLTDLVRAHHASDLERVIPGLKGRVARLIQVADLAVLSALTSTYGLRRFSAMPSAERQALLWHALPQWFPRRAGLDDTVCEAITRAEGLLSGLDLRSPGGVALR